MREITPQADVDFRAVRENTARLWREKIGQRKITVGDREVSDTVEAQAALILVNATQFVFKPGPRNYDRTWIRDGSSQALALLWAGLIEEAKTYAVWYSKRVYENGMVPPILNMDGSVSRGYGSDIEFDAQGEFIGIAADIYRVSRDRDFLNTIFEPVVRAAKFIEGFARAPMRNTARRRGSMASLLHRLVTRATASRPIVTGIIFCVERVAQLRIPCF
jgi:hypothetical protein